MDFDRVLAFSKILATSLGGASKHVLANLRAFAEGDDADATAEGSNAEPLFGAIGVVSRPLPPDATGHAEVIAARREDGLQPLAGRDLRISRARGNVNEGAASLAGYRGGFVSIEPTTGGALDMAIVYLPYALATAGDPSTAAKAHSIIVDTAAGNESIQLVHGLGHSVMLTPAGDVILSDAGGANWIKVGGSGILSAGACTLFGGVQAGNPALAQPVALYPAEAALATALETFATAAAAILNVVLVSGAAAPLEPSGGPLTAALAAAAVALAAAATAVATPATGAATTLTASPV